MKHCGSDVREAGCLVCQHCGAGGPLDGLGWTPIGRICCACIVRFSNRMQGRPETAPDPAPEAAP